MANDPLPSFTRDVIVSDDDPAALLAHSLMEPEVQVEPFGYYRAMRLTEPVRHDAKAGMFFVSRHADLLAVVRDPVTFSVGRAWMQTFATGHFDEFKRILERDGGGYFPDAIMTDPPTHRRVRGLMQAAFTPSRIKQLEPRIRRIAREIIAGIAPLGQADGVNDFAMPMTVAIMCEQLGVPLEHGEQMLRWALSITTIRAVQTREEMVAEARHYCDLQNYVIAMVEARRRHPGEDMISDLIHARAEGDGEPVLSTPEITSLARALLVGGLDSIGSALSNLLLMVASDPEIARAFEQAAGDEARLGRFIEESLRINPPARGLYRVATRDVELGGTLIPEGSMICLLFASGNYDEELFDEPAHFDAERKNLSRHLTFGGGIHMCIGQHLARMQLKVAAQEMAHSLKGIKLAIPFEEIRYVPTLSTLSIEGLPLTFAARDS
jgi:cytochrome P450